MDKSNKAVIGLILVSVVLGVMGQLFMKTGMKQIGEVNVADMFLSIKIFQVIMNPFVLIGVCFYVLAAVLWLVVLSKAELSYAYPMIALGYVITSIIAWLLFKENMSFFKFFGIVLIISGVYLISMKTKAKS